MTKGAGPKEMRYIVNDPALTPEDLNGFCVGWRQPLAPEVHYRALRGSYRYVTARDDAGKVVGFVNAISDGVLAAYIPLLEVLPDWQKRGIGSELMRVLFRELDGMMMVDLVCDPEMQPYYQRLGMFPMPAMRRR